MKNRSTPCAPQSRTGERAEAKSGATCHSRGRKWNSTTHRAATMRRPVSALISPLRTTLSSYELLRFRSRHCVDRPGGPLSDRASGSIRRVTALSHHLRDQNAVGLLGTQDRRSTCGDLELAVLAALLVVVVTVFLRF